jgi:hypothetical protein
MSLTLLKARSPSSAIFLIVLEKGIATSEKQPTHTATAHMLKNACGHLKFK